jgi:hypothetical protein
MEEGFVTPLRKKIRHQLSKKKEKSLKSIARIMEAVTGTTTEITILTVP